MKRVISVLVALLMACLFHTGLGHSPALAEEDKKIELVTITLKDLLKHIEAQKDKVVVLDVWGFFCHPCKEEFPNLVRLHETYGGKGLVCMSLSLDFNDELRKKALGFLREKKAVFNNYCLKDGLGAAGKQWNFEPLPVVVVYGKDGNLVKVFKNDDSTKESFTYKDVEALVKKLLEKK